MSFADGIQDLGSRHFYFVGIKGTGMTALAELMYAKGAFIQGSDVSDRFFTDDILEGIGIKAESFDQPIPPQTEAVVYSTAYDPSHHPQLLEAQKLGLPLIPYHQALGAFSALSYSVAVTGVHGKTTTTAMIGTLIQGTDLAASILVGSGVKNFGGKAVHLQGDDYFVAEACEYQRHFLHFSPSLLLVTSIEADHLDYFRDREDVISAFLTLGEKLPQGGQVLYCADQDGAVEFFQRLSSVRPDLSFFPYGFDAQEEFGLQYQGLVQGFQLFHLRGYPYEFRLPIPGRHNVLNAGAALAVSILLGREAQIIKHESWIEGLAHRLAQFQSTRRRSEVVFRSPELTVIDDYGHHPTAVKSTLEGYREFYPGCRIILSFMHHTYSRTKALYPQWLGAFEAADIVINHPIYSSARERADDSISGQQFAQDLAQRHSSVQYFSHFEGAAAWLAQNLQPKDVVITMGAGDNWKVGQLLIKTIGHKDIS
jgi:UDP-N-acetylmuramate--alanine ligase